MDKYSILLGYYEKQMKLINRLYQEISTVDLTLHDNSYFFALKTQQFYTALEDLLKQVAKSFENNIDDLGSFHKELLIRMETEIPKIRPAVLSKESFVLLDKLRAFRHFVRHAYDVELDHQQLQTIQGPLKEKYGSLQTDLSRFKEFVLTLSLS